MVGEGVATGVGTAGCCVRQGLFKERLRSCAVCLIAAVRSG